VQQLSLSVSRRAKCLKSGALFNNQASRSDAEAQIRGTLVCHMQKDILGKYGSLGRVPGRAMRSHIPCGLIPQTICKCRPYMLGYVTPGGLLLSFMQGGVARLSERFCVSIVACFTGASDQKFDCLRGRPRAEIQTLSHHQVIPPNLDQTYLQTPCGTVNPKLDTLIFIFPSPSPSPR